MSKLAGRSALVTGAGGFIGGHLASALVRADAKVCAFIRYTSRSDRGTLTWFQPSIANEVEVVFGDLRDPESVRRAMDGCEVVFHLGAQIAIPYSYVNPRDFFETNVLGSLNVAQAALDSEVDRIVHTSTSEVYGTAQTVPITEQHPIEPQSPYAASKVAADKLMDAFHRSYQLPVAIVRPFNTYGPHQSARAIVPTIILQALVGDVVHLGALDPRRDLTYVSDTVEGLISAGCAPGAIGRTIQLGTGHDVSVGKIVELVGELVGKDLEVQRDERRVRPPTSEVERLVSDPRLAHELMGWEPQIELREGLARTLEWLAANARRYEIGEYVI